MKKLILISALLFSFNGLAEQEDTEWYPEYFGNKSIPKTPQFVEQEIKKLDIKSTDIMINTCFDTITIEGIYYDLATYIPANGRYELENCLPHNLRIINEYKNGIPHGVEEFYYANGNMMSIRHFKNGLMHGILEEYNEDGSLSYTLCHIKGRLKEMENCLKEENYE